jgi:ABC-2 type transport system ATP-binding protein
MSFAVCTSELSRVFRAVKAVDSLDLRVPVGSIFGFLGPNGAGKTTTIRMLLGLIKPSAGAVVLNGLDLSTHRIEALQGVGAIVERPSLYPNLTGRETLEIGAILLEKPRASVQPLLDLVGLAEAAGRTVSTYSLGMRQRLALARALIGEPRLLILDEPTNGLDPAGIVQMRELIRGLPQRLGTTVMLSSHLLSEIEQTADHCALIAHGRLLFQDRLERLRAHAQPVVWIEIDRPEEAARCLCEHVLAVDVVDGRLRIQTVLAAHERALVLRLLVQAGFAVSGLKSERPTLESSFLELTERAAEQAPLYGRLAA